MMVEAPAHNAESATPTRMMLSGVANPNLENINTTTLDVMAPMNAQSAMTLIPTPEEEPRTPGMTIRIATVAPNAAPCEMPTVEAEASGFSRTLCNAAPANAKPAPETIAHTVRGSLIDCTVLISWGVPIPNNASTLSIGLIFDAPKDSSITPTMRHTRAMPTMQST